MNALFRVKKITFLCISFTLISQDCFASVRQNNLKVTGSINVSHQKYNQIHCIGPVYLQTVSAEKIDVMGPFEGVDVQAKKITVVGAFEGNNIKADKIFVTGEANLKNCHFDAIKIVGNSSVHESVINRFINIGFAKVSSCRIEDANITTSNFELTDSVINGTLRFNKPLNFKAAITLVLVDSIIEGQIEVEEGCSLSIVKKGTSQVKSSVITITEKKETWLSWLYSFFK